MDKEKKTYGDDLEYAFAEHGQSFSTDDIESVEAAWSDETEEPNFAWLLKLRDGRWATATGYHDFTGWDCQSRFDTAVFASREEAVSLGFTLNDRCNLELLLPWEAGLPLKPPKD